MLYIIIAVIILFIFMTLIWFPIRVCVQHINRTARTHTHTQLHRDTGNGGVDAFSDSELLIRF